jgi:hypothetical protein
LEEADILAVLLFAARLSQVKSIHRLASWSSLSMPNCP